MKSPANITARNEATKAEIRAGLSTLYDTNYGWGPHHDGLPLRDDVMVYIHDVICAPGEAPFDFEDVPVSTILMDERGSVMLSFEGGDGRVLELFVPCKGVVIARQKFAGADSFIEGRLDRDLVVLEDQLAMMRQWIEEVPCVRSPSST